MKFTHTVKFPLGKRYEMREFTMEVDDGEFPELAGLPHTARVRFMQGTLLQMGLVFQAASGYISPNDATFKEQMRLAHEMKDISFTSKMTTKVTQEERTTGGIPLNRE